MNRPTQYGALAGLLGVCLAVGFWGFTVTGGALPYAKRFATSLQRGTETGGGALVDLARGVVLAGPIRKGGLVGEFVLLTLALVVLGVALFAYAERARSTTDDDTTASRP